MHSLERFCLTFCTNKTIHEKLSQQKIAFHDSKAPEHLLRPLPTHSLLRSPPSLHSPFLLFPSFPSPFLLQCGP